MPPVKPASIDPIAGAVLERLAGKAEAGEIILGGYFALQQYLNYRRTHDIDAWWRSAPTLAAEARIREAMQAVAKEQLAELQERRFGETFSFELSRKGNKFFSFQIALRSVALEEPAPSQWPPIWIETLNDNIGSKMNALVNRGSPRDFVDIQRVVEAPLLTIQQCWQLWSRKNAGQDSTAARQKITRLSGGTGGHTGPHGDRVRTNKNGSVPAIFAIGTGRSL